MSDSRRKFLKVGVLTALFAAVPLKSALGQSKKTPNGNAGKKPEAQSDPLANYTKATFTYYLNSVFALHTTAGVIAVTLLRVDDLPAPTGGECFSLLFRGGSHAEGQDTYTLDHPSLGTFQMLLVPIGTDEYGAQGYLATINRLSYRDALAHPAPTRSLRKGIQLPNSRPSPTPLKKNRRAVTED